MTSKREQIQRLLYLSRKHLKKHILDSRYKKHDPTDQDRSIVHEVVDDFFDSLSGKINLLLPRREDHI